MEYKIRLYKDIQVPNFKNIYSHIAVNNNHNNNNEHLLIYWVAVNIEALIYNCQLLYLPSLAWSSAMSQA